MATVVSSQSISIPWHIINLSRMNTEEKFWSLINKSHESECWIWLGGVNNKGYGQFRLNGRLYMSHRLAYSLSKSEIPRGLFLCHKCDTPKCCNPSHMFIGTQSDNMIDRVVKNRQPNLVLTPEIVKEIRRLSASYMPGQISKKLNISLTLVKKVFYNESWKHVI